MTILPKPPKPGDLVLDTTMQIVDALGLLGRMSATPPLEIAVDDTGLRLSLSREVFLRVAEVIEEIVKGGVGKAVLCDFEPSTRSYVKRAPDQEAVEVLDAIEIGPCGVGTRCFIMPSVVSGMWELLDYACD